MGETGRERVREGESCVAERKGFALPVCKPPPGVPPWGGQVVPVVVSGCRWPSFLPDFAGKAPAAVEHSFTYCPNMERDVPIFASLPSFCIFSTFLAPAAGPGGGPRWWSDCPVHRPGRSPPLPVAACQPFGPEHRPPGDSPSLPSPLLFSSGQRFPLMVSVLLRCSSALGVLLGALASGSSLLVVLYTGVYFSLIQPRPE